MTENDKLADLCERIKPFIDELQKGLIKFGEASKPYIEAIQRNVENLRKDFENISNRDRQ